MLFTFMTNFFCFILITFILGLSDLFIEESNLVSLLFMSSSSGLLYTFRSGFYSASSFSSILLLWSLLSDFLAGLRSDIFDGFFPRLVASYLSNAFY